MDKMESFKIVGYFHKKKIWYFLQESESGVSMLIWCLEES